jgi:hypothetical protein
MCTLIVVENNNSHTCVPRYLVCMSVCGLSLSGPSIFKFEIAQWTIWKWPNGAKIYPWWGWVPSGAKGDLFYCPMEHWQINHVRKFKLLGRKKITLIGKIRTGCCLSFLLLQPSKVQVGSNPGAKWKDFQLLSTQRSGMWHECRRKIPNSKEINPECWWTWSANDPHINN